MAIVSGTVLGTKGKPETLHPFDSLMNPSPIGKKRALGPKTGNRKNTVGMYFPIYVRTQVSIFLPTFLGLPVCKEPGNHMNNSSGTAQDRRDSRNHRFYDPCILVYTDRRNRVLHTIYPYTIYHILILYTIYYILYTIYYILYTIYYILYTIYYILYTIYYILYSIQYTEHRTGDPSASVVFWAPAWRLGIHSLLTELWSDIHRAQYYTSHRYPAPQTRTQIQGLHWSWFGPCVGYSWGQYWAL